MTTTATRPVSIDYGCPDWCQRTDHHADEVKTGEIAVHFGPDFGRYIGVEGNDGPPTGHTTNEWDDMSAQDLRDLAAEAIAAAEWLEARK